MKTEKTTVIEFSHIIHDFCKLTGWSSTHQGSWNADFTKSVVFNVNLAENTCQYEQDWLCFYYPGNYEKITIDPESLLINAEKGKEIYGIGLGAIIQWLVLKGELGNEGEFLVKGG
jgi:hypothetical protein